MEKPCVLLVDDNEATRTLMTALLRKDHEVESAMDGAEAIEKIKLRRYDAIILDLLMPEVDGFGVLEHLKASGDGLAGRVIVCTAALAPSQMVRVHGYGVAAIVPKPFEVDHLLRAVADVVHRGDSTARRLMSSGMLFLLADLLRQRWM